MSPFWHEALPSRKTLQLLPLRHSKYWAIYWEPSVALRHHSRDTNSSYKFRKEVQSLKWPSVETPRLLKPSDFAYFKDTHGLWQFLLALESVYWLMSCDLSLECLLRHGDWNSTCFQQTAHFISHLNTRQNAAVSYRWHGVTLDIQSNRWHVDIMRRDVNKGGREI